MSSAVVGQSTFNCIIRSIPSRELLAQHGVIPARHFKNSGDTTNFRLETRVKLAAMSEIF
jgi:hypothetical protein